MIKYFLTTVKIILAMVLLGISGTAISQSLPSGYIGRVLDNTPYTWQTYSFTFTTANTGSNYFMLAFRQDPAYWSVDNIRVTASGSSTNLLTNGDMATGGSLTVNTSSGQQYITAPTAWGVAYQNGTYPAAAGSWQNGLWFDGAVGSYDAIYQALNLTAGVTYTITFDVNGDNTATTSTDGWQLGVYAGACSNVTLAPTECSLPSGSGFTSLATPSQTYTAGCTTDCPVNPDAGTPTVVSTITTDSVSVSTSSTQSSTDSITVRDTENGGGTIRTYNDVYLGTTTTTVTTTTTTPVTTTTYSDGSTTTTDGTPTSTSTTTVTYIITPTQGTAPIYSATSPNTSGNSVYIKQIYPWNNTQVNVTQDGNNNAVTGVQEGWAKVDGNGSVINMKQYGQGNIMGVKMNAWGNNIDLRQGTSTADANNNIIMFESYGNGNGSLVKQESNSNSVAIKMTYDINTVNVTQKTGTDNKSYVTMIGNWNSVNNTQNGTGNFTLVNISGDNNSATVNQTGNDHTTLLNLIGNKNSVSVTQTGTGDSYSLQQTCTNVAGCSVSVIRNK